MVGVPGCEQLVLGESTLTKVQAHHPLLAGVERFDGGLSSPRQEVVLSGTSLLVGRWDDGLPLVARNRTRRAIGGVVALNMVPYSTTAFVGSWDAATSDGVALMVSALLDARPVPVGPAGFPDVAPAAFYAGSVDWAGSAGVTTGYGTTGEFRPEVPVDRGQMAAFLHRTMDRLVGSPPSGFPDVPPGAFYRAAVDWAKASGVTTGFGTTGRYAPDEILTRGQMVTFLHRVAGTPGPHGPHGFPDVAPSAYYEPAVRWARATGVTTGYGTTGEFRPDEPVTRGQMVTFLNRLVSTPSAWHVTTQIPTTARF